MIKKEEKQEDVEEFYIVSEIYYVYNEEENKLISQGLEATQPKYLYGNKELAEEKQKRLTFSVLRGTSLITYLSFDPSDDIYNIWYDKLVEIFGEDEIEDDGELYIPNHATDTQLENLIHFLGKDFFYVVHTLERED